MIPTFCSRCGDAIEEGCDPRAELAELDALLERLTLKRYDLKRKINQLNPIIKELPPDVMSTIFEFCLPNFADHQLSLTVYPKEDYPSKAPYIPLSLGSICSYWREIAWSTPSLWSSLVVRVPSNPDSHMATGIAQEWLGRSGQLPLSIRILSISYDTAVSALADIISQYSTRWSDLDLYMPDYYYQYFRATDNHAPIFKSIRFHCSDNAVNLKFQPLTCPRLERASLSLFPLAGTNIQWDNLTHLTLHSMSIIDSFIILRKTPRLVFCKVTGSFPENREPRNGEPVLTSLRSLQLLSPSSAEYFLNNLTTPHLEEFSLPRYYITSIEVITSFLRRSSCSLRFFTVIFSISPRYFEGFMRLLQSMPSLNTLSLISITTTTREECNPRNILQLLAKVLSSQNTSLHPGFLPNLKILDYTGELGLRPENYDDLYSLPPADNAFQGPLHLVKLDVHPEIYISKNMISYLSSLVERGVTVNVVSTSKDILQSSIDFYMLKEDQSGDWADYLDLSLLS